MSKYIKIKCSIPEEDNLVLMVVEHKSGKFSIYGNNKLYNFEDDEKLRNKSLRSV